MAACHLPGLTDVAPELGFALRHPSRQGHTPRAPAARHITLRTENQKLRHPSPPAAFPERTEGCGKSELVTVAPQAENNTLPGSFFLFFEKQQRNVQTLHVLISFRVRQIHGPVLNLPATGWLCGLGQGT